VRRLPIITILFSSVIGGCQATFALATDELSIFTATEPNRIRLKTELENIHWKLVSLRNGAILPGKGNSQVYIRLLPEGNMMEGFGGCNRLRGHYEADGSGIRFSTLTATRKVCPGRMEVEQALLKALESAAKWRVEGESMELTSSSGDLLVRFDRHERQEKR
jgi:heat shock protein HslJ